MVRFFGAYGMIYSSGFYYLVQIILYFIALKRNFGINIKGSSRRFVKILISSLIMVLPAYAIHGVLPFDYTSRLTDIALMGALGLLMLGIYYFITVYLRLPQKIFGIKDISIRNLITRFRP